MALTPYTAATDIIENLGTNPEDRPTLNDETFKAKFDENAANIKAFLNALILELSSTAAGKGASAIGVQDAGGLITATTVEAALAELAGTGRTTESLKSLADLISTKVNPNVIINPCGRVNQRVKSGTVTLAAGAYGHDRWKAGASGCTYTFASSGGVTVFTITAGSLIQVVEGNNLVTDTYVLSWTGTAQGKIGAGSLSASGVTGAVTGGSDLSIEFGTGTLSKVKLERGSVPTPFELRPFDDELRLCRRYYEKSYQLDIAPGANTATCIIISSQGFTRGSGGTYFGESTYPYKVSKRATPTVTLYAQNGTANAFYDASTGNTITGGVMTAVQNTENVGITSLTTISSAVSAGDVIYYHFVADAEI
jgi:hypothetical protein